MSKKRKPLSIEHAAFAERELRFGLNIAEGLLGVLETQMHSSMCSASQPEVEAAFREVEKAISAAYKTVRTARNKATSALHERAFKDAAKDKKSSLKPGDELPYPGNTRTDP